MHFNELPRSTHALIHLRPIVATDIPVWFGYLSLPVVYQHTSWNVQSPSELDHFVGSDATREADRHTRFAVALRSTDELIGTAGFHSVSALHRTAELAYDLAPTVWGKGIATYVCGLLTSWAHGEASVLRVQATVLQSNERSARVLERCSFVREGLLRSYRLVRGVPGDFHMYSHVVPSPT